MIRILQRIAFTTFCFGGTLFLFECVQDDSIPHWLQVTAGFGAGLLALAAAVGLGSFFGTNK